MPISTELLNSTFTDLRGPLVNSFVRSNELFEALDKKARIPAEGGTYIERTFSGAAPARGVGIYVGDELLNMTRRQEIRKFRVEPHRIAVAINIPKVILGNIKCFKTSNVRSNLPLSIVSINHISV